MGSSDVQVRLLGRFAVSTAGEDVPPGAFGGRLSRRLLRLLVCADGDLVPRDVLVDALWGDRPPEDPAANLKVLVNRARRVVGEAIATAPGGYRLAVDACEVDAHRFLDAVADGTARLEHGDVVASGAAFDRALALWTGEPLQEDLYEPWAEGPRRRLQDAHLVALEGAARAALARRQPARAVECARMACRREPLREGAHVLLARALAAAGDRPAALRVLQEITDRTIAELGLDPSPAVDRFRSQLLAHPEPSGDTGVEPRPPTSSARPTVPLLPFVAHHDHLARAVVALDSRPPRRVIVAGAPGAGKSRFLDEMAAQLVAPVRVRAHPAERDRDGSLLRDVVRAIFSERPDRLGQLHPRVRAGLAMLVPELDDARERPAIDPQSLRSLVTEGVVGLLRAVDQDGGTLLVDDAQWADPSSLQALAVATDRLPGMRIVVAHRPQAHRARSADDRFLDHLHAATEDAESIHLVPFTREALESVAMVPLPALLVEHTDGSPFAVTQVVAELYGQDLVERRPDGRLAPRPDTRTSELVAAARLGHERAIRTRVARQPGPRRELLELACLLGRAGSGRLLAAACQRGVAAVLEDLDALTHGGLMQPTPRGWAPAHDLTASTVVKGLDPLRRRHLHVRLSDALHVAGADLGEIAVHLEGSGDPTEAARAHARAARDRLSRAATEETAHHAAAGLGLAPTGAVRRELLRLHAEALAARDELPTARSMLREALREATDGRERAGLLTRLALLSLGADDIHRAEQLAELAIVEAGDDATERARSLAVAAVVDMNQRRPDRARERSDRALELFQSLGDAAGVAGILDARAMARFLDGDVTGAIDDFHTVATAFEDAGQLLQVVTPRSTRGHALVFADRPADGLVDIDAAAELASALGYAEGQAYAAWHRSEALTALGRLDEALAAAEGGLEIARSIDHRGWRTTAHLAIGLARAAGGEDEAAGDAYRAALESSESLPLFHGWAAARLARLHLKHGRPDAAAPLVAEAQDVAPALGGYEARLAQVELALAREEPSAGRVLEHALALAADGGHLLTANALRRLARGHPDEVLA